MQTKSFSRNLYRLFTIAFLLILVGVSCSPAALVATPVQTVVVVPQVITQVVTQIVYVPVTITPTPTVYTTDTPTITPIPSKTPTVSSTPPTTTPTNQPPLVTVLVNTECLFGPDPAYIGMTEIKSGSQEIAIGRSQDTGWLYVQGADHKTPCWIKTALAKAINGVFTDAPVATPVLTPYTSAYPPPPAVSTTRTGNSVSIFWLPVAMSQADYNGYLIEAWVCQGGKLVFVPKSYVTSYDKNSKMMAIAITDEPGCSQPSSARIYTVTTTAYSSPKNVLPWPPAPTPTPATPTITPTP